MVECAVILAVGNPSHQSQLAFNRPRAMLPVLGKPLVLRILDLLYRAGIRRFIVVVGENEGAVAAYLPARLPNSQIEFALQPSSGSLTRVLATTARQLAEPFLLASYNAFVHPNFPERLLNHYHDLGGLVVGGAPLTLSTSTQPYWAAVQEQQITRITQEVPKPLTGAFLLTDFAICGQSFIEYLSGLLRNTSAFTHQFLDLVNLYLKTGGQVNLAETSWTLPIETDYDLLTLNRFFLDAQQDCHILSDVPASVQIIPPVRIDPQVSIGQGAQIGPRVYLEAGCSIGQYAVVSDSIVLQNTVVPARQHITNQIASSRVQVMNPGAS